VAMRNAYKILIMKPEDKRPLQGFGCRWMYNIKMELKKRVEE
jgi:hypothetical protein